MRRHVNLVEVYRYFGKHNYLHLQMLRPFSETFLNFYRLHGVMFQKTSTVHGKCRQDLEPYLLFITRLALLFPVQRIGRILQSMKFIRNAHLVLKLSFTSQW